jgi:hypothetical protein
MTISTIENKVSYNGNGVTTVFAFPYLFFENTDLDVYRVDSLGTLTLLTLTTDYTVTGAGAESGGTVTMVVPPATGTQLLIVRTLDLVQETDYIEGDPFPAETHERALDRLTMIAQQIQEQTGRALTLPVQSSGVSAELPAPVANAFIGWNSAADALQNNAGASSVPVSLAMTPVVAAATLAAGRTAMGVRAAEESSQTTRIDVASAATVNLTTSAPSTRNIRITGTTTITGFTVAAGQTYFVSFSGALTLTNNANIVTNTGANIVTAAGDSCIIRATAANTVEVISYDRVSSILGNQIQPIVASVAANALTVTLNPTSLDFRSATLGTGTPVNRNVSTAISVVVPSGATLGTVNAVQSDIVVLAIDNAGTVELAVVNIAGGVDLSETGVISTATISAGATSASTIYSTTGRTNVGYRVVGIVRSTQATAGTWASAPTLVQGAGGNALSAMSSLGYGQTWQSFTTVQRAAGTTYYNTTGKPIMFMMSLGVGSGSSETINMTINGVTFLFMNAVVVSGVVFGENSVIIPVGASYSYTASAGVSKTIMELR